MPALAVTWLARKVWATDQQHLILPQNKQIRKTRRSRRRKKVKKAKKIYSFENVCWTWHTTKKEMNTELCLKRMYEPLAATNLPTYLPHTNKNGRRQSIWFSFIASYPSIWLFVFVSVSAPNCFTVISNTNNNKKFETYAQSQIALVFMHVK